MISDSISIVGAREHNLKNITVDIPRNRLTVITGLSGSGKSSLAFDTLFAEGQRRYVESLSAYARQFLDQMQKPNVEHIEGLSPAIAIEQRSAGSNPRSIVATSTEIHDYLRLIFANIGKPHCPSCGKPVMRQSAEEIVDQLMQLPNRSKVVVMTPLISGKKGRHEETIEFMRKQGFVRARIDGEIMELDSIGPLAKTKSHSIAAVVDRLIVTNRIRQRLTDSVELALKHGRGVLSVRHSEEGSDDWHELVLSERNACHDCGISFEELAPRHFSFNSPYGACSTCSGLGSMLVFDEDLIVPDPELSIEDGAIPAWRRGGRRLILYYRRLLRAVAKAYDFDVAVPFKKLPLKVRRIILHGSGDEVVEFGYWRGGGRKVYRKPFEGVIPNLMRLYETTESDYTRQRLRKYMNRQPCESCHGRRLKPEVTACTLGGSSIVDVTEMSISDAFAFWQSLALTDHEEQIAGEVLKEIRRRLKFLIDVGLEYLSLDRESGSLSGGEAQRLRLATQIGSGLTGVLYVLDEPTIGLHQRDNQQLIGMLQALRDRGNTVVVVEHDEDMIRSADHVIDMGPGAGRHGGHIVFAGDVPSLLAHATSHTAEYLNEHAEPVRLSRKPAGKTWLRVVSAAENNLKSIDVRIPLGLMVCVTGVSGSGKSTLVDDILRKALFRKFYSSKDRPGKHKRITGADHLDKVIVIDQSPIGRTPRSNPATYTGAFSPIRDLLAQTPAAKIRGYKPGRFSFNVKGGRCEVCKGDGIIKLEMHFLPDVYVECERCQGKRYNRETLEILYGEKNISEILEMTIDEALEFFERIPVVARKLRTLTEVGLGYLQLGQPATTLSGGEAQRVKLASELSKKATGKTLYLLDEPTTGLHFADTRRLLDVLQRLRESGNTVLVIEHNMDVIKMADHIIDLGPEGGERGGEVVAAGTPEEIASCDISHTGAFLREILA